MPNTQREAEYLNETFDVIYVEPTTEPDKQYGEWSVFTTPTDGSVFDFYDTDVFTLLQVRGEYEVTILRCGTGQPWALNAADAS